MSAGAITAAAEDWYTSSDAKEDTSGTSEVSQEAFLDLLMAQMTHQNPLEPMNNQEFMSQMAQLQSLEEQRDMTASMASMAESINGLRTENQEFMQSMIGGNLDQDMLYSIDAMRMENQIASASALIGKYVHGTTTDGADVEGTVKNVTVENGIAYLNLEEGDTPFPLRNVIQVEELTPAG